mmetsp:Transcript_40211/g.95546  ORF Transcript_40211/g.95546 Transcript_40211/m.95546 type:complete len:147 (+) Transcript_40211:148-588(+)
MLTLNSSSVFPAAGRRKFSTIQHSSAHIQHSPARGMQTQAAPKTPNGADVMRTNVGIFGCMNAGKSTLINVLTDQETSIVDATPGTTADTKIAMMELHDVGPIKLFDTAGIDETGGLGSKKVQGQPQVATCSLPPDQPAVPGSPDW